MAIGIVKNFNKDKGFGFINMEGELANKKQAAFFGQPANVIHNRF